MRIPHQEVGTIYADASKTCNDTSHRGIFSRYRRRSSTFVYAWHEVQVAENRTVEVQEKSGGSANKDALWQTPYDNGSLIKLENYKKLINRSYQPIKKGELYPRKICGRRGFMVSINNCEPTLISEEHSY